MHAMIRTGLGCVLAFGLASSVAAQVTDGPSARLPPGAPPVMDSVDLERIKAELDGKNAEQIRQILPSLLSGSDVPVTNSLGQASQDLVFVPATPCRIIDTRLAGGAFAAGESRSYHIAGSANYAAYGGNAAGCGVPGDLVRNPIDISGLFILSYGQKVRAVALNFVAVTPSGAGNLRAWPTNQTVPTAATMNYSPALPALANGVIVTSCDAFDLTLPYDPCPSGDVTIRADASTTHLVVDVQGYFVPATGFGQRASNANNTYLGIGTGCTNLTSVSLTNGSSYSRTVVCIGTASAEINHTTGTIDQVNFNISNVNSTTCGAPQAAAGEANWEVPAVVATGAPDNTLALMTTFEIASGASATYYLNGYMAVGGDSGDAVPSSNLTCFIP
jgi:hypothetical protein